MGLVNGKQRNRGTFNLAQKTLVVEAFRRDVQQLQCSACQLIANRPRFIQRQRRIQPGRFHAFGLQKINLVFHQGDKRRHDERHALVGRKKQGGQLVGQRFAAARGENRKGRAPIKQERPQRFPDRAGNRQNRKPI